MFDPGDWVELEFTTLLSEAIDEDDIGDADWSAMNAMTDDIAKVWGALLENTQDAADQYEGT